MPDLENLVSTTFEVNRLAIDVGQPFEEFRRRYERAVPELDQARIEALVRSGGGWDAIVADSLAYAPHGFFLYWKMDTTRLMSLAGNHAPCTEYLMGNHVIAERMFRHDPSVMLYAPLRLVICVDVVGRTRFVIEQPSSQFSSFGNAEIAKVGIELDEKLAALLGALDVAVPPVLRTAT